MSGRILPICENLVENTSVKSFDSGSLSSRIKRNMDYRAKKKMMKRLSLHDAAWESQRVRVYAYIYTFLYKYYWYFLWCVYYAINKWRYKYKVGIG